MDGAKIKINHHIIPFKAFGEFAFSSCIGNANDGRLQLESLPPSCIDGDCDELYCLFLPFVYLISCLKKPRSKRMKTTTTRVREKRFRHIRAGGERGRSFTCLDGPVVVVVVVVCHRSFV